MAEVKMRISKETKPVCEICGATMDKSLEIYDLMIPNVLTGEKRIITFCDLCNDKIFSKSLSATVKLQGKTKSQHDIQIINSRNRSKYVGQSMSIAEALRDSREDDEDGD